MTMYWRTDPSDPYPTPRHKNEKDRLSQMDSLGCRHTHLLMDGYTHTHTHKNIHQHHPTVSLEWNQWLPKGWGVDVYVNSLCLKVKWGKGEAYRGVHSRGGRTENRGMEERVFRENEVSFLHSMHCGAPLTKKYGKQGSALQREYAWRGEHCSGNNKVVKSLSLQAPCTAHLDLMAGVLSLLLYYSAFPLSFLSSNL